MEDRYKPESLIKYFHNEASMNRYLYAKSLLDKVKTWHEEGYKVILKDYTEVVEFLDWDEAISKSPWIGVKLFGNERCRISLMCDTFDTNGRLYLIESYESSNKAIKEYLAKHLLVMSKTPFINWSGDE